MLRPIKAESPVNSFLKETEHNSDIEDNIRLQIEDRYRKSIANRIYVFPRKTLKEKLANSSKTKTKRLFLSNFKENSTNRLKSVRFLNSALTTKHTKKPKNGLRLKDAKSPYLKSIQSVAKLSKIVISNRTMHKFKSKPILS